jgi:hypothetical protein
MQYLVLTIALLAASMLLLVCARKPKNPLLRRGIMGLISGFALGFLTAFLFAAAHYVGPAWLDIELPNFTFDGVAYGPTIWLPPLTGFAGFALGLALGLLKKRACAS